MPALRISCIFLLLAALSVTGLAQTASSLAPVPADPLELVTGSTLLLNSPENRALVLGLLERARQSGSELYEAGGPPFTLKLSFTASGQTAYSGSGEMEETRFNRFVWRWAARLGDYSQLRIFHDGFAYDETPGPIPLRVQMVRDVVIWSMAEVRPGTRMRMASAKWNGMDVMCALLSGDEETSAAAGRRWEEREYCVDTKDGLLRIYSEAPGIYTVYDYDDALQFHKRTLARKITVSEAGEAVLQIHLNSIKDAGTSDPAWFTPTKDMQGPGVVLTPPVRLSDYATDPNGSAGTVQSVIVHAALDDNGKVLEAEALQNSDPSLSSAAVSLVRNATYKPRMRGEAPRQREAFINVKIRAAQ